MKNKNQVFKYLTDFKILAEEQSVCKLKVFSSDNGGEYVNKLFAAFCVTYGIILYDSYMTVAYTPQQNGVAERMNRTLLDQCI